MMVVVPNVNSCNTKWLTISKVPIDMTRACKIAFVLTFALALLVVPLDFGFELVLVALFMSFNCCIEG